jgi:hypothetical protein
MSIKKRQKKIRKHDHRSSDVRSIFVQHTLKRDGEKKKGWICTVC